VALEGGEGSALTEENITIFSTFCTGTSTDHFVKEKTLFVRVRYGLTVNISHIGWGRSPTKWGENETFCEGKSRLTMPCCLYLCMCVYTAVLKFTHTLQISLLFYITNMVNYSFLNYVSC